MARAARVVVPGMPHHVTQRGNRRARVFVRPGDMDSYMGALSDSARQHGLDIWAYCLMSNHIHLVAVPAREDAMAIVLRDVHSAYAQEFNRREGFSGHLWQGRYYSCVLDERHLWAAVRYVERNPVRAGIVARAEEYPWSSARAHCGLQEDRLLAPGLPLLDQVRDWRGWLGEEDVSREAEAIRRCTRAGSPCGGEAFIEGLERKLGVPLRPRQLGRKKSA